LANLLRTVEVNSESPQTSEGFPKWNSGFCSLFKGTCLKQGLPE